VSKTVVLDLRRPAIRSLQRLWLRWERQQNAAVACLERCTAAVIRASLAWRLARRCRPARRPFVLSIGNLASGGTGKTPVVIQLAEELAARGLRGAVLTRGYGSRLRGPVRVDRDDHRAGDEARLLAARLPRWAVIQARNRQAGLQAALLLQPVPDIVVLEDGHQTARVGRHLDVLILDRWRQQGSILLPQTGRMLPWGPYREGPEGARRAGIWLLEMLEAPAAQWIGQVAGQQVPVLPFRRRLGLAPGWQPAAQQRYGVVSGIAHPARFEAACAALIGHEPALAVRFDDHHAFSRRDVRRLQDAGGRHGLDCWLTTEKDWLKLASLWSGRVPAGVVRLSIEWLSAETLPDLIEERVRRNSV
jgi:tetraacyldisaccharide 4'-kinase